MANVKPPAAPPGSPVLTTVAAGTVLYRIHQKIYTADSFNPLPSHRYYGGGRFDGTNDDPYPFLYAGGTVDNCIAETLLRDLPVADTGARSLARVKVRGRRISALTVATDIEVVSLVSGTDLGAVAQDPWLTVADPCDYAQTRHWGHWIRQHASTAGGYVWASRREPMTMSYVLFGDRVPAGAVSDTPSDPALPLGVRADFDSRAGLLHLRRKLRQWNVTIARP